MEKKLQSIMHFLNHTVHDAPDPVFFKDVRRFISTDKSVSIYKRYKQVRIAGYKAF